MTETVSDLLPCPFCGSDEVSPSSWDVKCSGCGAEMPGDTPHAIEAWNRRTPPQNTDGEAVAWMHPTAGWAREKREEVAVHCQHGGPGPIPLVPASALSAMKAERDALAKALEPFAKCADHFAPKGYRMTDLVIDQATYSDVTTHAKLTRNDFRRANEALAATLQGDAP